MDILVIEVGGTHVKALATGRKKPVTLRSGPKMTATEMVRAVREATDGRHCFAVSIGYPGPVLHSKPVSEPRNLGGGRVSVDFKKAFGCPIRVINDAADVVTRLQAALETDDVVVRGGNAKRLHRLPKGVRLRSNANAFVGGYRLLAQHA